MTISYTATVATCKHFGCFWKLIFRWKASIYKLIWPNMILYISLYTVISLTYRFALDSEQRRIFEEISIFCDAYRNMIPVSFVLGFYVSIVVKRWWDQYLAIPWPDPLGVLVSVHISGTTTRSRLMRRSIMRYANLALVMTFRLISPTVKKRFPTLIHLVDSGFLLENELEIMMKLEQKMMHPKYWVPIVWATGIVSTARQEKIIKDDFAFNSVIDHLNTFRQGCLNLYSYDWISIPLVYTQVVTLAVYSYFMASLLATQYLDPEKGYVNNKVDLYVPYFAMLEFFFLMGWLLVAESLVNPFGENDDDIEVGWMVDRNLQISYLIVDEVHEEHPNLLKDPFWDDVFPPEPPQSAKNRQNSPYLGSTWEMQIPNSNSHLDNMDKSSYLPFRSNMTSQFSRVVHHSNIHSANFLANSRRVHKESHAIITSIKNKFTQAKSFIGVSQKGSTSFSEDTRYSKRQPSNNIERNENTNNFINESEFQSRLILKKNNLEPHLSHSWHALLNNNNESYSDVIKYEKLVENHNAASSIHHNTVQYGHDIGSRKFDQSQDSRSQFTSNSLLHPKTDTLDRSFATRHSYYGPETMATSTTLYTINEEKDQGQNNYTQNQPNNYDDDIT